VGRTGAWWGADHYPIEPDVITAAKGLRVGATVARSEIFPEERARLSSTWGAGDVLNSLLGALTIEVIEEYDLLANARERGAYFADRLREADLAGALDVRNVGLMLAVEFDSKPRRDAVMECALKRGLLTLPCGHRTLRLLAPMDVTEREIDLGVGCLREATNDEEVQTATPRVETADDAS